MKAEFQKIHVIIICFMLISFGNGELMEKSYICLISQICFLYTYEKIVLLTQNNRKYF